MTRITHITPIDEAPEGFRIALFDFHADTAGFSGHFKTAFVRDAGDDMVHVISIRRDGDFSGLFHIRPKSHIKEV